MKKKNNLTPPTINYQLDRTVYRFLEGLMCAAFQCIVVRSSWTVRKIDAP